MTQALQSHDMFHDSVPYRPNVVNPTTGERAHILDLEAPLAPIWKEGDAIPEGHQVVKLPASLEPQENTIVKLNIEGHKFSLLRDTWHVVSREFANLLENARVIKYHKAAVFEEYRPYTANRFNAVFGENRFPSQGYTAIDMAPEQHELARLKQELNQALKELGRTQSELQAAIQVRESQGRKRRKDFDQHQSGSSKETEPEVSYEAPIEVA